MRASCSPLNFDADPPPPHLRRRGRSPAARRRAKATFWHILPLERANSNLAPKVLFGITLYPQIQITSGFLALPRHGHRLRATSLHRRKSMSSFRPRLVTVLGSLPWASPLATICHKKKVYVPVGL